MLEEYDGATPLPSVEPNRVQVWIQIHKIPPLYRTEKILKQLAGKVGEVISVEMKAIPTSGGSGQGQPTCIQTSDEVCHSSTRGGKRVCCCSCNMRRWLGFVLTAA